MSIDSLSGSHEINKGWTDRPTEEKVEEVTRIVNESGDRFDKNRVNLKKAMMNQQLAMDYYQVLIEPESYSGMQAKKLIDALMVKARSESEKGDINNLRRFLSGARTQGGLMQTLENAGYWVMFPDSESDVITFDVRGIDVVATDKGGRIFFLGVRGRSQRRDLVKGGFEENVEVRVGGFEKNPGFVSSMLTAAVKKLRDAGEEYAENKALAKRGRLEYSFGWIDLPSGRKFMDFYGKFSEGIKKAALEKLRDLPKDSWT